MFILTLAVLAALCFVFSATRPYGLICLLLLIYLNPFLALALLIGAAGLGLLLHWR
jgi:hypothetical protein